MLNKSGGGGGEITVESLTVTENGMTVAPAGTAYSPVSVNVQPTLQSKTVTENGTVTPDQGYDGLSSVVVNVSGGGGAQGVYRGTSEPQAGVGSNGDYYIQDIPLPSSVNYVDYLESSGAQYIDTDIKGDQTTTVYVRFRTVASNPDGAVFGARQTSSSRQFCIVQNKTAGKVRLDYYSSNDNTTVTLSPNTEYELIHGQVVYNANGKIAVISSNISSFETPGSMYIFGMNNNGAFSVGTGVIIYRLTIRKNGLVMADFVPALDANNVPCMYEAVSGTYYYNAGSGAFSYGSPASPIQSNNVYKKANGTWSVITQSGVSMV